MVNIWIKNRISIILRQTFNSKIMKKTLFTLIALLLMSVGTMWGTEKVENKNVIINKVGCSSYTSYYLYKII